MNISLKVELFFVFSNLLFNLSSVYVVFAEPDSKISLWAENGELNKAYGAVKDQDFLGWTSWKKDRGGSVGVRVGPLMVGPLSVSSPSGDRKSFSFNPYSLTLQSGLVLGWNQPWSFWVNQNQDYRDWGAQFRLGNLNWGTGVSFHRLCFVDHESYPEGLWVDESKIGFHINTKLVWLDSSLKMALPQAGGRGFEGDFMVGGKLGLWSGSIRLKGDGGAFYGQNPLWSIQAKQNWKTGQTELGIEEDALNDEVLKKLSFFIFQDFSLFQGNLSGNCLPAESQKLNIFLYKTELSLLIPSLMNPEIKECFQRTDKDKIFTSQIIFQWNKMLPLEKAETLFMLIFKNPGTKSKYSFKTQLSWKKGDLEGKVTWSRYLLPTNESYTPALTSKTASLALEVSKNY